MLLRLFRSTSPIFIILIPLLGLIFWMPSFIHSPHSVFLFDDYPMPSYKLVREIIPVTSFWGTLLTFTLVILQAIMLVRLNTRFIFINNRTYLPALIFILLTVSIPDLQRLNPVIFSGFFLLLAIELLFNAYRQGRIAYEIFSASFFISLGATFYPFFIFYLFIVWAGLVILRPFYWREWFFSILGFILPWFFVFSYYYLLHDNYAKVYFDFAALFKSDYDFPDYSVITYIFGAYLFLLILLASQFIIKEYTGKKILTRKAFLLFLWLFINTVAVYFIVDQASIELVFLGAIPISYLLSHYFTFMKSNFWGDVFLGIFLLLIVIIQFGN